MRLHLFTRKLRSPGWSLLSQAGDRQALLSSLKRGFSGNWFSGTWPGGCQAVIGVSVVIILFWTSFNGTGMASAEPWSPYKLPAIFLLGAILLTLAVVSLIEKLRDREGDLKVPDEHPGHKSKRVAEPDHPHSATRRWQRPDEQSDDSDQASHARHALRVLVADDNSCNRMLLRKRLASLGFKATAVQDGFTAVEAAFNEPWDLILMDGQMPGMDGLEATRHIRSHSRVNRGTLIVAVTSNTTRAYRRRCLAAGMDGFYGKPSTMAAVKKLIQDCLSLRSSRTPHRSAAVRV